MLVADRASVWLCRWTVEVILATNSWLSSDIGHHSGWLHKKVSSPVYLSQLGNKLIVPCSNAGKGSKCWPVGLSHSVGSLMFSTSLFLKIWCVELLSWHLCVWLGLLTIINTKKYESGLSRTLHRDLHWLDVTERIQFRLAATVYQCLHGMAPAYLTELCTPVAASASLRGGLRSSTTSDLVIPRCRLSTYGSRAFSVAGPVCWNALQSYLKSPDISFNWFRQQLKTFFILPILPVISTTLAH